MQKHMRRKAPRTIPRNALSSGKANTPLLRQGGRPAGPPVAVCGSSARDFCRISAGLLQDFCRTSAGFLQDFCRISVRILLEENEESRENKEKAENAELVKKIREHRKIRKTNTNTQIKKNTNIVFKQIV